MPPGAGRGRRAGTKRTPGGDFGSAAFSLRDEKQCETVKLAKGADCGVVYARLVGANRGSEGGKLSAGGRRRPLSAMKMYKELMQGVSSIKVTHTVNYAYVGFHVLTL